MGLVQKDGDAHDLEMISWCKPFIENQTQDIRAIVGHYSSPKLSYRVPHIATRAHLSQVCSLKIYSVIGVNMDYTVCYINIDSLKRVKSDLP